MDNECEVRVFKLVSGEEFIAKIILKDETKYVLDHPVKFQPVPQDDGRVVMAMMPFLQYVNRENAATLTLYRANVICTGEPDESLIHAWNQQYGSGLVIPATQQLIV